MQVVALHGFLGLPSDWEACAIPHLHAIDLSDFHFPTPSEGFETWAHAFNNHICSLIPTPRLLLSYSLGGRLALHALLQDPSLWQGAVFLSTHPGLKPSQEKTARLQSDKQWAHRFLTEPWDTLISAWNGQPTFKHTTHPPRSESFFNRHFLAETLTHWSLAHQANLTPQLLALKTPILWAVGEHDHRFQKAAPCKPHIISSAGHRLIFDAPHAIKPLIEIIKNK